MPQIEKYTHSCIVPTGNMAGNKNYRDVSQYDVMFETNCEVCGGRLATLEQIMLHMYAQLTE